MRYEIRLSGSGGQGLVLAGIVLAEAAAIHEDRFVVQSQNYGPEARGGKSRSDVIISDEEIDFPHATSLDCLAAMNQSSCDAYFPELKPEGLLVVDSTYVKELPNKEAHELPLSSAAKKKLGREIAASVMLLGAISELTGIVSLQSLTKAVKTRVPEGTEKLNTKALKLGAKMAGELLGED